MEEAFLWAGGSVNPSLRLGFLSLWSDLSFHPEGEAVRLRRATRIRPKGPKDPNMVYAGFLYWES